MVLYCFFQIETLFNYMLCSVWYQSNLQHNNITRSNQTCMQNQRFKLFSTKVNQIILFNQDYSKTTPTCRRRTRTSSFSSYDMPTCKPSKLTRDKPNDSKEHIGIINHYYVQNNEVTIKIMAIKNIQWIPRYIVPHYHNNVDLQGGQQMKCSHLAISFVLLAPL